MECEFSSLRKHISYKQHSSLCDLSSVHICSAVCLHASQTDRGNTFHTYYLHSTTPPINMKPHDRVQTCHKNNTTIHSPCTQERCIIRWQGKRRLKWGSSWNNLYGIIYNNLYGITHNYERGQIHYWIRTYVNWLVVCTHVAQSVYRCEWTHVGLAMCSVVTHMSYMLWSFALSTGSSWWRAAHKLNTQARHACLSSCNTIWSCGVFGFDLFLVTFKRSHKEKQLQQIQL